MGQELMNWPEKQLERPIFGPVLHWSCDPVTSRRTDSMQQVNSGKRQNASKTPRSILSPADPPGSDARLIRSGTGRNAITGRLGEELPLSGVK